MADITTTITSGPSPISFAGNPILYTVETSKSLGEEESFLRIACTATFSINGSVGFYEGSQNFTVELTQPVANKGTAIFNLSDAAQTLIRNVQSSIDMNSGQALDAYGLIANVVFKTVFIFDNQEVSSGSQAAPMCYIVPGKLTDFERLTLPETDLLTLANGGKAMTRKPDGGVLYKGESLIVPTLYAYYDAENPKTLDEETFNHKITIGEEDVVSGASVVSSNELDYQNLPIPASAPEGAFQFTSGSTMSLKGYYRSNNHGVHFLRFINGFGAVENISVRAKEKLSYEVSGETHSLVQQGVDRTVERRYATKAQPVGVYELSSGYVPQRWAEWFVQELLTAPRVWIQVAGKWIPALIEAKDDCVIYDRTKPEMPHVDFTLRLAIDGVTGVSW